MAWSAYALVAAGLAALALIQWLRATAFRGPVLYGEGAVAHAALLARTVSPYADPGAPRFIAANYPPFFLDLVSLGDPFVIGRVLSIIGTLAVAATVALMARGGGLLAAGALSAGFMALVPVSIWGAALKPDLVALGATAVGVLLLTRQRPLALPAGALLAVAAWTKPTALLPAAAIAAWLALRGARGSPRSSRLLVELAGGAAAVSAVEVIRVVDLGVAGVWQHVVVFNALPWSASVALQLGLIGLLTMGVQIAIGGLALARSGGGALFAYLAAALAIVALGGREGATINYLLDLATASTLALAAAAPALRASAVFPLAAAGQLVLGMLLLNPFGIVPGRAPTTGAWGAPERAAVIAELPREGRYLVEDAGLLIMRGDPVVVDDLFLWSRLVARGTIDPAPLIAEVRSGGFDAIVSEADLAQLERAPLYERHRWDAALVQAVLERYRLLLQSGGLWVYRRR